ncbi:MAG: hypothetical protein JW761_03095 [Prolixibacteraceae bacterium]|nr:hypothetical protein [Prolixibacteraceae bacterium]
MFSQPLNKARENAEDRTFLMADARFKMNKNPFKTIAPEYEAWFVISVEFTKLQQ